MTYTVSSGTLNSTIPSHHLANVKNVKLYSYRPTFAFCKVVWQPTDLRGCGIVLIPAFSEVHFWIQQWRKHENLFRFGLFHFWDTSSIWCVRSAVLPNQCKDGNTSKASTEREWLLMITNYY